MRGSRSTTPGSNAKQRQSAKWRRQSAKQRRQSKEDLRRANTVEVTVDGSMLSEEALCEVARREAREPMTVNCLDANTNQTVSITVTGWEKIKATVVVRGNLFADAVCFAGAPVDVEDCYEDLEIEDDATLIVAERIGERRSAKREIRASHRTNR